MSQGHANYLMETLAGRRLLHAPGTRAHAALTARMDRERARTAPAPAVLTTGRIHEPKEGR